MRQLVNPKTFGQPTIGLALFGCTNRPFYHICVFPDRALGRRHEESIIEQLGTFDPLPNDRNEKLVSLNIGRLKYWIGVRNAPVSVPALELLGLAGLFPIHPKTFIRAKDNREALAKRHAEMLKAAALDSQSQAIEGDATEATQS
ncbi:Protein MRPS-16 [Aphelenchoides avenae]|nr:Protein MRPS-16 [Aphelenchus avenae]KAH7716349.1 Protein MRPS-16 [Aphelenchus avenae]